MTHVPDQSTAAEMIAHYRAMYPDDLRRAYREAEAEAWQRARVEGIGPIGGLWSQVAVQIAAAWHTSSSPEEPVHG